MYRLSMVLVSTLVLFTMGLCINVSAQKKSKKNPETTLHVPTLTLPEDTIFVDLTKPVEMVPVIPLESSLREEQKNPKGIVIVPAPPPFPGKDPVPPKYPDPKQ